MRSGMILPYRGLTPHIDPSVFLAPGSVVIGDAHIGADSSVWFGAVIRADVFHIRIGRRVNIQDLSMVHVTHDTHPTIIEDDVTVGHRVVLHGCHVERGCLIGMGAVVMDKAHIGHHSLVGAGSLVTEGTIIPPYTLAVGSPAKPKRALRPEEIAEIEAAPGRYTTYAAHYLESGIGTV